MDEQDNVTQWILDLQGGDALAAQRLWDRYFHHLARLADRRLKNVARLPQDGEDVALSAFHSLCAGVHAGRFGDLTDRESLWKLLVGITVRKTSRTIRDEFRQKRGGGRVVGESAILSSPDSDGRRGRLEQVLDHEPTPDAVVQFEEILTQLFDLLGDEELKQIASWKMQGFTSVEIAKRLGKALSTIERRLKLIRTLWSEFEAN